jgi:hypothetical protein
VKLLVAIGLIAISGFAGQSTDDIRAVESLGPGVYYRSADGLWTKMEPISSRGFESRPAFMSAKAVAVYSGAASAIQMVDRRPTFYLKEPILTMLTTVVTQSVSSTTTRAADSRKGLASAPSPTVTLGETSSTYSIATQPGAAHNLVIVRLGKRKKQRELTYAGGSVFNFRSGIDPCDLVETALSPVEGGGYFLRPKIELKPGEYLILMPGPMGIPVYGHGFDFGVSK